jgi:hypothetical protein
MEEGDGAGGPVLISSGRIMDEVVWYIPVISHSNDAGEVIGYGEVSRLNKNNLVLPRTNSIESKILILCSFPRFCHTTPSLSP